MTTVNRWSYLQAAFQGYDGPGILINARPEGDSLNLMFTFKKITNDAIEEALPKIVGRCSAIFDRIPGDRIETRCIARLNDIVVSFELSREVTEGAQSPHQLLTHVGQTITATGSDAGSIEIEVQS